MSWDEETVVVVVGTKRAKISVEEDIFFLGDCGGRNVNAFTPLPARNKRVSEPRTFLPLKIVRAP